MRAPALLVALGAVAFPTPAAGTEWFLTTESPSGLNITFVDRDSIRPAGDGVRRAQVYAVFRNTTQGAESLDALMEFDCRAMRRRYVRITGLDARLRPIRTEQGSLRWGEILPNTQDAMTRAFVCSDGAGVPDGRSYGPARPFAIARERLLRRPR